MTGLIAGDKATVAAINRLFLNKNDQSSLNKFLTQARWDEEGVNRRRVAYELARLGRRPVNAEAGRSILDDTLAHHTRCSMAALAYLRDHSIRRTVWAHNVVTSYYPAFCVQACLSSAQTPLQAIRSYADNMTSWMPPWNSGLTAPNLPPENLTHLL